MAAFNIPDIPPFGWPFADMILPLTHRQYTLTGKGLATDYAACLLESLGATVVRLPQHEDVHPALAWAASGAMALTGRADGSPLMCPAPLASCVEGVRIACAALADIDIRVLPDAATLGERAAISGLTRRGDVASGGACRLLHAADGWLALNLPRDDDWTLLPAWLETGDVADWASLATNLAERAVDGLIERARLLGLAVAGVGRIDPAPAAWCVMIDSLPPLVDQRAIRLSPQAGKSLAIPRPLTSQGEGENRPLVVDLSSLWAGPLCSHLLQLAGARVVKVESLQRPDGARRGPVAFHDLLNHGKASVALDFSTPRGVGQLRALLERADIVIEGSRPRALRQLGIRAEEIVAAAPGLTWISISGYGRDEPQAQWIAYGDDAGVAGGLTGLLHAVAGDTVFCSDAIADPLTGWHAALAALAGHLGGGGRLISLALTNAVRHCGQFALPSSSDDVRRRWQEWTHLAAAAVAPPRARLPAGAARPLGADTAAVLAELDIPC